VIPDEVLRVLTEVNHPYADRFLSGARGFEEFRTVAAKCASILNSCRRFRVAAYAVAEGAPLPEFTALEEAIRQDPDLAATQDAGMGPIPEGGEGEEEEAGKETFSPTEEGDQEPDDALDAEDLQALNEAEARALAHRELTSKVVGYLTGYDPREVARRVLYLAQSGVADLRVILQIVVQARLSVHFQAGGRTAEADSCFRRDLSWGATREEALERHRSRCRAWNRAIRQGEEIHAEGWIREPGTKPTLMGATGDYRLQLEWEWSGLNPAEVHPDDWRYAVSLAHLLDMVRCRRAGVPLTRRPIPTQFRRR
jgi:hypothetical protein